MKLVVVYNVKSGGKFSKATLESTMNKAGIDVTDWIAVNAKMKARLAPYCKKNAMIAVVGGDGTQRAVADSIIGTGGTMAPLPGGTLNHFTKDLKVPQDMQEAIMRLPTLQTSKIDIATVNDKVFINNSSIGLYPQSLLEREKTEKFLGKWLAAIRAVIVSLLRFRKYHVEVNGEVMRVPYIFVGNNNYDFTGSMLAERTSLTGGMLTLFVLHSWSRLRLLRAGLFDRLGSQNRSSDFLIEHSESIHINARQRELAVSLDGEVIKLATPLVYKIKPKSLKVLV